MEVLYSLYDALVSIKVPADNARAVVGALERDMSNTLATKADLRVLRQELMAHTTTLMAGLATRDELKSLRDELKGEFKDEMDHLRSDFRNEMDHQSNKVTVRLGSMLVVVIGLILAALGLLLGQYQLPA